MSTISQKYQMSEEDIKLNYITSACLSRGCKNKITMETKVSFADGKINLKGNKETLYFERSLIDPIISFISAPITQLPLWRLRTTTTVYPIVYSKLLTMQR